MIAAADRIEAASCRAIIDAAARPRETVRVIRQASGAISASVGGHARQVAGPGGNGSGEGPDGELVGWLPAIYPEWLGDRGFLQAHGVRFPYVAGAMANGIATPRLVVAMARAGILGFFGAAGLSFDAVEAGLDEIIRTIGGPFPWGASLIHSPHEPMLEERVADLFIRWGVRTVEASAFLSLTPSIVRYACSGLHVGAGGSIERRHRVFAKLSRPEVARRFMMPAPAEMLRALVESGKLSAEEARLAVRVPLATDVTVEADSGGHTDNRPLTALLPTIIRLRDECEAGLGLPETIRVGAAGGLGTPSSVAAAFALGAAYVLTGSINQSAIESGLSDEGKRMLAEAGIADVGMAAAADMFELGVKLQVLKRGTMFSVRANKLYELYRDHASLEAIPAVARGELETKILGAPIDTVWRETENFWQGRDPSQAEKARADAKHRMALVFRWYLGKSSRWAIAGESPRRADYQIWCGPAMGAFNAWVAGSFLEPLQNRGVVQIALNLIEGAAVITRAQQLRSHGVPVPAAAFDFRPRPLR